jgi:hypothetical protein
LGTILTLRGRNLGGDTLLVQLVNQHLQESVPDIPATLTAGRSSEIKVAIPNVTADASKWVAGIYAVSVAVTTGGVTRSTNSLPLPFAPQITAINAGPRDAEGNVLVTVTPAPLVKPAQTVFLSLPDRDVPANTHSLVNDPLKFSLIKPAAGQVMVRLRVDGVDSMQFKSQGVPPRPVLAPQPLQIPT